MPYLPENEESKLARHLSQAMQEHGNEIRTFMPRYGCVNERRNQLHEVIRLSGMNLIINDDDHQLIIKVSSIPSARSPRQNAEKRPHSTLRRMVRLSFSMTVQRKSSSYR